MGLLDDYKEAAKEIEKEIKNAAKAVKEGKSIFNRKKKDKKKEEKK